MWDVDFQLWISAVHNLLRREQNREILQPLSFVSRLAKSHRVRLEWFHLVVRFEADLSLGSVLAKEELLLCLLLLLLLLHLLIWIQFHVWILKSCCNFSLEYIWISLSYRYIYSDCSLKDARDEISGVWPE